MKARKESYTTKFSERLSYWSYFVGQNIFYILVSTFLTTYIAFAGIELIKIATVMLVVKIWDAVNDPLFGIIFDKVKFKSKQKSLPWLRISLGLVPLTSVILFAIPASLSENFKLFWFGVAYLLWDSSYTLSDVPIFSMVTTMTANMDERNSLMSIGRLFSMIASSVTIMLSTFLLGESVGMSFTTMAIVLAIAGLLFMTPLCLVGKERNYNPDAREENFTLRQTLTYLVGNKYLLIYFAAFFCSSALFTTNIVQLFASYYLFGSVNFSNILYIASAIPSVLVSALLPRILRKVDKFKLLFWTTVIATALGFVIYFIGWESKMAFLVLAVLRNMPLSLIAVLNFMFTADCAEYGHFKTGIDAKGIAFAIQTFSAKLTAAISSAVALFALSLFGWQEIKAQSFDELSQLGIVQTPTALSGLWITYLLIPTIGMLLTTLLYFFYKLNDKDVQIMAQCNSGEITKAEAEAQLSRTY